MLIWSVRQYIVSCTVFVDPNILLKGGTYIRTKFNAMIIGKTTDTMENFMKLTNDKYNTYVLFKVYMIMFTFQHCFVNIQRYL